MEISTKSVYSKWRFGLEEVALTIVCAAVFAAGCLVTAPFPLSPQGGQWRFTSMLPAVYAIMFGPIVGTLATYFGERAWTTLVGFSTFEPIGFVTGLIFSSPMQAFIPGVLVRNPKDLKQVTLWSVIGVVYADAAASIWGEFYRGTLPWFIGFGFLQLNNFPLVLIGTPLMVRLLLDRVVAMGLYKGPPLGDAPKAVAPAAS